MFINTLISFYSDAYTVTDQIVFACVTRVASLETEVFVETEVYDALMLVKVNITCIVYSFWYIIIFLLTMFLCYALLFVTLTF